MSGTPCCSCRRWVPESGSSIFCTLCGGSFQLVRLEQDPKFTARDLESLISSANFEWVRRFRRHPLILLHLLRLLVKSQNSSQEGRGPPSSPPQRHTSTSHSHRPPSAERRLPSPPTAKAHRRREPRSRERRRGRDSEPKASRKHREDSPDWKLSLRPSPQSTGKGSSTTSRSRASTSTFKVASCRAPSCASRPAQPAYPPRPQNETGVKGKGKTGKQKQKKKNRGVNRPLWWAKHQASKSKSLASSGPPSPHQEPLTKKASGEEVGQEEPNPPDKVLPPPPSQPLQEVVSTSSPEAAEALKARERSWADASEEVDP